MIVCAFLFSNGQAIVGPARQSMDSPKRGEAVKGRVAAAKPFTLEGRGARPLIDVDPDAEIRAIDARSANLIIYCTSDSPTGLSL